MAYLVNGVEYSTKKDATAAAFEAAEAGEVTLSKAPEAEPEAEETLTETSATGESVVGPAEGPGFIL